MIKYDIIIYNIYLYNIILYCLCMYIYILIICFYSLLGVYCATSSGPMAAASQPSGHIGYPRIPMIMSS